MNVYVCVKVVPDSDDLSFDPERNTIRRGAQSLNPADLVAIELALELKKRTGCHVFGVCMGPAQAERELHAALYLGLEEMFLLSSPVFAGSDVSATAYVLSRFFTDREFDLILCGSHSSDGNTGLVGPYLAELLGVPHLGSVSAINQFTADAIEAWQTFGDPMLLSHMKLPGLIVVSTDAAQPHTPSLRDMLLCKQRSVTLVTEETLEGLDPKRCGSKGSATRIRQVHINVQEKYPVMYDPADIDGITALLCREAKRAKEVLQ